MEDHDMNWRDKDDLDLTAEDLAEVFATGTPVEVVAPLRTLAVSYRPGSALGWSPTVSSLGSSASPNLPMVPMAVKPRGDNSGHRLQPA